MTTWASVCSTKLRLVSADLSVRVCSVGAPVSVLGTELSDAYLVTIPAAEEAPIYWHRVQKKAAQPK